jgi:hypothetical protein
LKPSRLDRVDRSGRHVGTPARPSLGLADGDTHRELKGTLQFRYDHSTVDHSYDPWTRATLDKVVTLLRDVE